MGCNCQSGNEARAESKVRKMAKLVNFEGKMVPYDTIPQGCLFIRGVWYGSAEALPEELKSQYTKVFVQIAAKKAVVTPAPAPEPVAVPEPVVGPVVAPKSVKVEKKNTKTADAVEPSGETAQTEEIGG